MNQHILLCLLAMGATAFTSTAQTNMMEVVDAKARATDYKVEDISEFDAANPMTVTLRDGSSCQHSDVSSIGFYALPTLANQYQLIGLQSTETFCVNDVTELRAVQHYNVPERHVETTDYWFDERVMVAVDYLGEAVGAMLDGRRYTVSTNDFRLTKNRLNDVVALSGLLRLYPADTDFEQSGSESSILQFNVSLDPLTTYAATGALSVSNFQVEPFEGRVGTILYKPSAGISGESPRFIVSDVAGCASASDVRSGRYALDISLAGNRFKHGTVDLANTDDYRVYLYDYESGKTHEITSHYSGTITTLSDAESGGDNVYVKIDFEAPAGYSVSVDYYGPIVTVDQLDDVAPQLEATSNVILTNQSGVQTVNQQIGAMQLLESIDGTLHLYMMCGEASTVEDKMLNPQVHISREMIGAGELSLPDVQHPWRVQYKNISLEYADNQWKPAITNGTIRVDKDSNGRWDITVNLKNEYNNMGSIQGTGEGLSIHYAGPASAYTGNKK